MYLAYNTMAVENMGKPAVMTCHHSLAAAARSHASMKGMPGLRIVPAFIPCDVGDAVDEIGPGLAPVIDEIVSALTRPLSLDEQSPKQKALKGSQIAFSGDLEEVNRYFYKSGLSDGSPVIPPTEESVRDMMSGTDLYPEHLLGYLGPRKGKATVEKIAVNAVMAGAIPAYFPVILAGVEALLDPNLKSSSLEVSMGSWARFWIVNGPVRHDLAINGGIEALSLRDKPNATIGRALGLCMMNIGGARPGVEVRGALGNPGKYSMVIAENEEESPWEPLHVQQGLKKEESAVTVQFNNNTLHVEPYGRDTRGILRGIIYNITPGTMGYFALLLTPPQAKRLADEGWNKEKLARFMAEYARVPAYQHPWSPVFGSAVLPVELQPVDLQSSVAMLREEYIRIIVAGGPTEHFMGLFWGTDQYGGWITKKVHLPKNWDVIAAKSRDLVPNYMQY